MAVEGHAGSVVLLEGGDGLIGHDRGRLSAGAEGAERDGHVLVAGDDAEGGAAGGAGGQGHALDDGQDAGAAEPGHGGGSERIGDGGREPGEDGDDPHLHQRAPPPQVEGAGRLGRADHGDDLAAALGEETGAGEVDVHRIAQGPEEGSPAEDEIVEGGGGPDVGAAPDPHPGGLARQGEDGGDGVEEEGGGAGGPDLEDVVAGRGRMPGTEPEVARAELVPLDLGADENGGGPDRGEMLRLQAGLVTPLTDPGDLEASAGDGREGECGPQDLAAPLPLRTVELDVGAIGHGRRVGSRSDPPQASTVPRDEGSGTWHGAPPCGSPW